MIRPTGLNPPKPKPTPRQQVTHKLARDWVMLAFTLIVVVAGTLAVPVPATPALLILASGGGFFLGRQGR